jgi:N-acetylglucosaminyldiphosphoundecaprenol N-acetyl-beta-D-mannosaminyltransferase
MKTNRIQILNCPIDKLTNAETLGLIDQAIQQNKQIHHTVVNAGKLVMMQTDPQLHKSVVEADLINADGMAVVWASKILGQPLPERVAGVDLMQSLVEMAFKKGYKAYFLGAKEEVVSEVVRKYSEQYSAEIIAGYRNGYFNESEELQIAQDIARSGANMLFVAISSPKKENFLYKYRHELKQVNFIMGVGGSFDVVAGKVNRAPVWMQKVGLEWFYRFAQEPRRMWKRYTVGNYRFIKLVMKEYFSGGSVKLS